ncbi:MFS transporter [Allosaccharopolyspora coralli]|uniref:MFS transporter n=1 Tax=Allosaccharopolyspora coralli TaxID=2665642 RepID=A0A5Q3QGQ9_9PSEU|nr:MFS transporter [Allosaccharopolyspora coralli]QGK69997.1 MFS transporter [Allosaccharopolyspora coralli]
MGHPYRDCFAQPHTKYLLATNLLGRLQNGMGPLSIALFLRSEHLPYAQVGLLVGLFAVATAIGGPLLGRLVDKHGQTSVLIASAFGSAAGFVFLTLGSASPLLAAGAVILAGSLTPPLEPCLRSLWEKLLGQQRLVAAAYSLDASLQQIVYVVGPLLVVVIAAATSPALALWCVSGATLVGTLLFVRARPVRQWQPSHVEARSWVGPLRSGELRKTLLSLGGVGFALGVFSLATVMVAEANAASGNMSGLFLGAHAAGALIGGLIYGSRTWPASPGAQLPVLFAGLAFCYLPLLTVPAPALMIVFMGMAGLFLSPVLACGFVIIGEVAPEGTKTEAFAWVVTITLIGNSLGSATSGAVQSAGLTAVFALPLAAAITGLVISLTVRSENTSGLVRDR